MCRFVDATQAPDSDLALVSEAPGFAIRITGTDVEVPAAGTGSTGLVPTEFGFIFHSDLGEQSAFP
jgi:hypothetical protein